MTSAGTPTVRPAEPADRDAVVDLLRVSLGTGGVPRSAEYLAWKHEANPFGPSLALVAEADGRPVAYRAFLRWSLERGGQVMAAVRSVDSATHPDWQRRGLFTRLTRELVERAAEEGIGFVFNTPNQHSRPGYVKLGWRSAGRVRVRVRPVAPPHAVADVAPPSTDPGVRDLLDDLGADLAGRLLEVDGSDSKGSSADRLATHRDPAFIAWRYAAVPGVDYRARWRRTGGGAAAVIYRRRRRRGLRELTLVEILSTAGDAGLGLAIDLLRGLVGDAVELAASHVVAVAASGTPQATALRHAGFPPPLPFGPLLTARPLAARTAPRRWADWRFSAGDLELF